jgi:hypothetical protein
MTLSTIVSPISWTPSSSKWIGRRVPAKKMKNLTDASKDLLLKGLQAVLELFSTKLYSHRYLPSLAFPTLFCNVTGSQQQQQFPKVVSSLIATFTLQHKNFKSPLATEQVSKALSRHQKKQFEGRPTVTDFLSSLNLTYVVPES